MPLRCLCRRRVPHEWAAGSPPRPQALFAAFVYASSSAWMLYNAFKGRTGLLPWLGVVAIAGLGGYFVTEWRRARTGDDA